MAHLDAARQYGAELRHGEPVREWKADANGVEVRTDVATYLAAKLIVTAGAWGYRVARRPGRAVPRVAAGDALVRPARSGVGPSRPVPGLPHRDADGGVLRHADDRCTRTQGGPALLCPGIGFAGRSRLDRAPDGRRGGDEVREHLSPRRGRAEYAFTSLHVYGDAGPALRHRRPPEVPERLRRRRVLRPRVQVRPDGRKC